MVRSLLVLVLVLCLAAGLLRAESPAAEFGLLPGWRTGEGHHIAAIRIDLAPGWKTYWRRPGEAGIPPEFGWSGSENVADIRVHWPVPEVFRQEGLRSVGYRDGVVLPVEIVPIDRSAPVHLALSAAFGICRDICVPVTGQARAELPPEGGPVDPRIQSALANRPLTASEAGARIDCAVTLTGDGAILTTRIAVPPLGETEEVVFEPADTSLWISPPESRRDAGTLVSRARIEAVGSAPLVLDRSALVTTVLSRSGALEMHGCE